MSKVDHSSLGCTAARTSTFSCLRVQEGVPFDPALWDPSKTEHYLILRNSTSHHSALCLPCCSIRINSLLLSLHNGQPLYCPREEARRLYQFLFFSHKNLIKASVIWLQLKQFMYCQLKLRNPIMAVTSWYRLLPSFIFGSVEMKLQSGKWFTVVHFINYTLFLIPENSRYKRWNLVVSCLLVLIWW